MHSGLVCLQCYCLSIPDHSNSEAEHNTNRVDRCEEKNYTHTFLGVPRRAAQGHFIRLDSCQALDFVKQALKSRGAKFYGQDTQMCQQQPGHELLTSASCPTCNFRSHSLCTERSQPRSLMSQSFLVISQTLTVKVVK